MFILAAVVYAAAKSEHPPKKNTHIRIRTKFLYCVYGLRAFSWRLRRAAHDYDTCRLIVSRRVARALSVRYLSLDCLDLNSIYGACRGGR